MLNSPIAFGYVLLFCFTKWQELKLGQSHKAGEFRAEIWTQDFLIPDISMKKQHTRKPQNIFL